MAHTNHGTRSNSPVPNMYKRMAIQGAMPATRLPIWQFTAFNNTTRTEASNLIVTVTMNTSSTAGLTIDLLDASDNVLASAPFSGTTATITVTNYISPNTTVRDNLKLRFGYGGALLSESNNPFGGSNAQYTISVSAPPVEDLIAKIRNNRWILLQMQPGTGNRVLFSGYLSDTSPYATNEQNKTRTGRMTLEYSATSGVFRVLRGGATLLVDYPGLDAGAVQIPTGIVLYGENFSVDKGLTVTNISLNGNASPDPTYNFNSATNAYLITNFYSDPDGSFRVEFDYQFANGGYSDGAFFGIYLGYK